MPGVTCIFPGLIYILQKSLLFRGIFVFDKKAFYAYTKGMGKIKTLEQKLDAILEYLDIDLDYREGFEVKKHKEAIGFHEREKRL